MSKSTVRPSQISHFMRMLDEHGVEHAGERIRAVDGARAVFHDLDARNRDRRKHIVVVEARGAVAVVGFGGRFFWSGW